MKILQKSIFCILLISWIIITHVYAEQPIGVLSKTNVVALTQLANQYDTQDQIEHNFAIQWGLRTGLPLIVVTQDGRVKELVGIRDGNPIYYSTDNFNAALTTSTDKIQDGGWLYLAKVMDAYNREIIGWAVDKRMTKGLVINAMERAMRKRRPSQSLIFHSDRGSQYASYAFRRLLVNNHIRQSMSGKGNCYDNAMAESFFKTLKTELIYQNKYQTRQEAKQDIFEYIEVFYNRQRLHSALGYKTPIEYGELTNVA